MIRCRLDIGASEFSIEVPGSVLAGNWAGPSSLSQGALKEAIGAALDAPEGYPPLEQLVVRGDRVTIAFDPSAARWPEVLHAALERMESSGVSRVDVTLLPTRPLNGQERAALPEGPVISGHDPDLRASMAYLATTEKGIRIYLNRALVDADVVVPIGRVAPDPALGFRGPWSVVYPDLSDTPRVYSERRAGGRGGVQRLYQSCLEVNWLLGSLLHVGVIAATNGASSLVAGEAGKCHAAALKELRHSWTVPTREPADLVVASVGGGEREFVWDDLARALGVAGSLVRQGGRVALLTAMRTEPGPALQRLAGLADPRDGAAVLKGAETDADFEAATALTRALEWADVYLLSHWPDETLTDLGLAGLHGPEDVMRLIELSDSCLVVNRAEESLTRVHRE